ncbi:MAG: indole-3-glycerol phosphate synthase TrpC [Candidatus Omnitrophica bacterium]|nr:indole-3-glycerol phosphate synthase TrpC [Candidatus Omnitrophota bacterium]MBU1995673.1 indole-3-glycerol phosphate synthase TrpC [Candidatus Omnitrophota bacterium]MBU4334009.1 indole-3-glycerol phosphate synthase TrpC [Candidatus Omnitrophota bacterium]
MSEKFLEEILAYKKELVKSRQAAYAIIKEKLKASEYTRYEIFKKKISEPGRINLIAEIKKASPSKGLIRKDFNCLEIAKAYQENGACAISVLTEDKYFLGDMRYLGDVANNTSVPVLQKDFFVDEGQIYEARVHGASAILLIVAALDDETLKRFIELASSLDIDCLVEVHNEDELARALFADAEIIGINNRNLKTFEVDLGVSERLIGKIPSEKVIVVESGIKTHEDINKFYKLGANAVLIGETFMKEQDIGKKIQEVIYGKS